MPALTKKIVVSSLSMALRSFGGVCSRSGSRLRRGNRRRAVAWDRHTPCIRPQPFQPVMMTGILAENMNDDVAEIHEYPLRRRLAFDAQCAGTRLGQHAVDMVGDRPRLPVRVGGPQHQIVSDGGQLRNMEDEDVRGLLVYHGPRNR